MRICCSFQANSIHNWEVEREGERNRVNIDRNAKWMRHITKQLAPETSTFFGYSGWWWYVCYAVTLCVSQLWCEFVATKRRDVSFVSFPFRIFIITLKVYLCVTWFSMYSGWHFIQVNVIRKLSEIFKVLVPWDILYFRLRSSSLLFVVASFFLFVWTASEKMKQMHASFWDKCHRIFCPK